MKRQYRNLIRNYIALVAALVCFLPVAVFGQVATATITGVITDQQGAVIPGVKVSVKNLGTGAVRDIETSSAGTYVVALLSIGTYTVTAEKEGFKSVTVPQIVLAAGDNVREDLQLQIGQVTQTVQVTGAPPALQTENASLGTLINPTATEQLPLNGRNVQGLMMLVPGSTAGGANSKLSGNRPDDRRPISAASINGMAQITNNFMIDGADNNERFVGSLFVKPQIDALAEVKIDTNNYSAAASRTAGGVINFITKSGTDEFHGSVYEFLRNTSLDARNYFDYPNRGVYHQNQFGGAIGGPIQKGKTFFFGDVEILRQVQGQTYTSTIPTAAMKQGNFQGVAHIFNPYTTPLVAPYTRTEYANDVIPAYSACTGPGQGCMDPFASQMVQLYPNSTTPGANNFAYSGNDKLLNSESFDGRIDHTINSRNTIYGRYSFNNYYSVVPAKFPLVNATFTNPLTGASTTINGIQPGGGNGTLYYGYAPERAQNVLLAWTRVFSPTFVMDAKVSYQRFAIYTKMPNYGLAIDGALGIPNSYTGNINTTGLIDNKISGYDFLGDTNALPIMNIDNGYEYLANFNWQHSSHNIKFGGRFQRRLNGFYQSVAADGVMTFDGNFTNDPTKTVANSGNAIASFLLGAPSGTSRSINQITFGYRMIESGLYVQDDWQVTKTLTVNLGVRWDYFPYISEKYNRATNLDFNLNPIAFVAPYTNGLNSHDGVATGNHDFGPRIGFAKRFGGNTVLRGGFGISFIPLVNNLQQLLGPENPPYTSVYQVSATTLYPINTIDQGFPAVGPMSMTNPLGAFRPLAFNYPLGYGEQYNLTAERNMSGFVFRLAYVGNLVRHGEYIPNMNQAPPGLGAINPRRPFYNLFPNAADIYLQQGSATANYHALEFSAERRYKNGFSFLANYTWSRDLDNGPSYDEGSPDNSASAPAEYYPRLKEEYGLSDLHCAQRGVISGTYELPWGKSLKGLQGVLAKGWQANGILIMQSGFPFTAINSAAQANTGDPDRPNQVGDWHVANPTIHRWFNTAAFAYQTPGTLGSAGRDTMIGPPLKNLDFSIFKNFKLSERFNLQFRAECFNVANHANFNLPGNSVGSSSNGVISDTANYVPRLFQFALKLSF